MFAFIFPVVAWFKFGRAGHGFTRQRMCLRLNDCAQARNALTGNLFGSGSCSPQRLHAKPYKDPGFVPSLAIIQG